VAVRLRISCQEHHTYGNARLTQCFEVQPQRSASDPAICNSLELWTIALVSDTDLLRRCCYAGGPLSLERS
jgi:hypothetical protein